MSAVGSQARGAVPQPTPLARRPQLRRARANWPGQLKPRLGRPGPHYRPRPATVPAAYAEVTPPPQAPSISIVTPALNAQRFIGKTVASVVGQRYPALEHIVMDGGSTDATLAEVRAVSDRATRVVSESDPGSVEAINRGFALSDGEIMGWLNSDDVLLPGTLAYVARYMAAHPEVDLVYGHRMLLDSEGRDVGIWVTPPHGPDTLRWFNYLPQETAFWRRELWERAGGLDESLRVAYDWDLFSRFEDAGARIVRLPRFLGGFRLHPAQQTLAKWDLARQELLEIRARRHGRRICDDEARSRVDLYRLRSVPLRARERLLGRLRRRRVAVLGG